MKTIKYFSLILVLFFSGCELSDVNNDPNQLSDVPIQTILPRAQYQVASATYNDLSPVIGIFMQYFQGKSSTNFYRVNRYEVDNSFYIQDVWNAFYSNPLEYFKIMMDKAEKENAPHYGAIAKVLMAYSLGTLTSVWGDVPYSQAFQGSLNLNPAYDSQQSIYTTIQELLNQAIADFNKPAGSKVPGADDIYFNGDVQKWKQAARSLKARYFIHLTKRASQLGFNPADSALANALLAFSSSDNDLQYPYGYSASEENPFFRGKNETDIVTTNYYGNFITLSDPRRGKLAKKILGVWDVGPYYSAANSPLPLITYYELKFIEAEARLRINVADPQIAVALREAVRANVTKITASDPSVTPEIINTFVTGVVNLSGNFETDLNTIITQKYIAMYLQIESWTDYRRTGYPALTPDAAGDNAFNPGGGIPRRLAYVWTEKELNANCPSGGVHMQDRFWWDAQ